MAGVRRSRTPVPSAISPAVAAEPLGIGTSGARDPLAVEVARDAEDLPETPVLQRSVELRNPYVDSLSELQVRLLGRLRALAPEDPERERVLRLVQLTVNGVAAGLQSTG